MGVTHRLFRFSLHVKKSVLYIDHDFGCALTATVKTLYSTILIVPELGTAYPEKPDVATTFYVLIVAFLFAGLSDLTFFAA